MICRSPRKAPVINLEKAASSFTSPWFNPARGLGTLYLQSDLTALSQRLKLYAAISLVIIISLAAGRPLAFCDAAKNGFPAIIALAETARNITGKKNLFRPRPKNGR